MTNYEIEPATDYDGRITELYNSGKERADIASELGLRKEYVSRRLSKLRKWGMLTRESGRNTAALLNSEIRVYMARGMNNRQIMDLTGLSVDELHDRILAIKKNERKFNRSKSRRFAV